MRSFLHCPLREAGERLSILSQVGDSPGEGGPQTLSACSSGRLGGTVEGDRRASLTLCICFPCRRSRTMSAQTASGPTEDQVEILEYNFNKVNKHPDPTTLCLIAAEAGLTEEQTQVRTQAYSILGDWRVPMPPAGLRHRYPSP